MIVPYSELLVVLAAIALVIGVVLMLFLQLIVISNYTKAASSDMKEIKQLLVEIKKSISTLFDS